MVGLFKTLIIILGIWLFFRVLRLYIAPYLMKKGVEKMQQKMGEQMNAQFQQNNQNKKSTSKREGDVTIEFTGNKKNDPSEDGGEYVDFEEIKD